MLSCDEVNQEAKTPNDRHGHDVDKIPARSDQRNDLKHPSCEIIAHDQY